MPGSRLRVWDGRVTREAQDADPPVHSARAQDVLQLNGAVGMARALRTCRNECMPAHALMHTVHNLP